jgi:hypothetical protein
VPANRLSIFIINPHIFITPHLIVPLLPTATP